MGPNAHWTSLAAYAIFGLALVPVAVAAHWTFPHWRGFSHGDLWFIVAISAALNPFLFSSALWQSRREQGLLRLLPGAPRRDRINGWLATRFAAHYVGNAAVVAAVFYGLDGSLPLAPDSTGNARETALCILVLSPLVPIAFWRDWSRMRAPSTYLTLRDLLIYVGVMVAAVSWATSERGTWWELGALVALVAVPLGVWRWRAISRSPVAWPVGRR